MSMETLMAVGGMYKGAQVAFENSAELKAIGGALGPLINNYKPKTDCEQSEAKFFVITKQYETIVHEWFSTEGAANSCYNKHSSTKSLWKVMDDGALKYKKSEPFAGVFGIGRDTAGQDVVKEHGGEVKVMRSRSGGSGSDKRSRSRSR
eukprot:gnl/TRDRNA2_/TRDRNA2_174333_c0_seq1.p1 gnl/TRDRNA2_/TRDRNA2_174333_c0~~gnl/TRDRNA2_/TRDRNA2_174333_c0_seq1.p1  ORF type:complete len:149 (-),score=31.33 gnl/TRDRNA2_/TRDRNA2_174333_c0_seq1:359-805(-)